MIKSTLHSRRSFIKTVGGSVALVVTPVPALAELAALAGNDVSGTVPLANGWSGGPGVARYRIEGLAKVTGQKIYARDFRARDMTGWPTTKPEQVAMILRAKYADRSLLGINLSSLPLDLMPETIIDQYRLQSDHITPLRIDKSAQGQPQDMFVAYTRIPVYIGQPVAILIFRDATTYRAAHRILQFDESVIRYGPVEQVPPAITPYSPPTFLTRYAPDGTEQFSQVLDGYSNPYDLDDKDPVQREVNKKAFDYRQLIREEMGRNSWRRFSASLSTQRLDPMFMEPEAGLGWLDKTHETLHLVLGTQATDGDFQDGLQLFADEHCPIDVATVRLTSCYPGGGFGGRDESPFSALLILAAAYADGPVRMARDRFEQFQAGLKRPGADMKLTLDIDQDGKFQAIDAVYALQAGGKNNYSQYIAALAGYSAGGGYNFPRVMVDATAQPTIGVIAGSMRGFGGPSAAFALESLIDEAAKQMGIDAIELRRRNAVSEGDRTVTGAPLTQAMRIAEICQRAAANPLWVQRGTRKNSEQASSLYGVGFALANQAYGTGSDGLLAGIQVSAEGALTVTTNCVDMGNGSATTLAIVTARHLGRNADAINMGEVEAFAPLQNQLSSKKPKGTEAEKLHVSELSVEDDAWNDPHYTGSFSASSSACLTAFHQVHAVEQASLVLFRTGLWPTACAIWGRDPNQPGAFEKASWNNEMLTFPGEPSLNMRDIAMRLHADAGVVDVQVHAYYSGQWISADYQVGNIAAHWQIDGLAVRTSQAQGFVFIPRTATVPPPAGSNLYGRSQYAPSATLAAVEVNPMDGTVRVTDIYTYLDAGRVLQQDLLSGQYQGAVAMGIGSALLEDLPVGPGGAGEGNWNLNRYHVAMAADVPLDSMQLELLEPLSGDQTSKGIAEAVLCPIAPAIANAVAAATGVRFHTLPISSQDIVEARKKDVG